MEAQVATRNITQQKTWFHYVIAALDPKVAAEVHSLVLHPTQDALYDKLRSELIKRTKASEQRRLQELLMAEELGNRKLTQLLWHMQQLLGDSGPAPIAPLSVSCFCSTSPQTCGWSWNPPLLA